ncbi:MAG: PD-(D/E)XK nuclease family protein [Acidobacteriia bacterium]|nr:PD-(D/E)XK nuclease family protein [Terriglobia bacterium]
MREETFRPLEAGATLITVNRRLARAFAREFHAYQRDPGRRLWRRPDILPLDAFLEREWRDRMWQGASDGLALLTQWQEQMIWEQVIRASPAGSTLLRIPETARNAMEAWGLIQAYRLPVDGRFEASEDWAAFAGWAREFEKRCQAERWLDHARLSDFVARRVQNPETFRLSPGFDAPTPQQVALFHALGDPGVIEAPRFEPVTTLYRFEDSTEEIQAAAVWSRGLLEENGETQIGIVVPGLERLRGKVERIFREVLDPAGMLADRERSFHVSLGPALDSYPLVHAALLALEFRLNGAALPAAGVLLRSPFLEGAEAEWTRRGALDARLRHRGVWDVSVSSLRDEATHCPILQRLLRRFEKTLERLPREQRASEWSGSFSELLEALGWPGERPLSSREYQVVEAWRGALSNLATLDLAEPSMNYDEALSSLRAIAAATLFQVENEGAPIQIMGMLEASGLSFDHLWIMGLHDEVLPLPANPNPFIPIVLQREYKLPHSSADGELEFARNLLNRLLAASPQVVLSYPASDGDHALAPSPLVPGDWQSAPRDSADSWIARMRSAASFEELIDDAAPPVVVETMQPGGAALFKDMAACPFRAFARHRLGAKPLEETTLGLSYKDRGNAVHKALQTIWNELGSQARLIELSSEELRELISRAVSQAVNRLSGSIGRGLEQRRQEKLLGQWLEIEKTRAPFTVLKSEEERVVSIGGIEVNIRADRIDELAHGRDIILDYKTGQINAGMWDTDRPDEPQLPLYCATSVRPVAGAAFAVIRTGELGFRGLTENGVSLPAMKAMQIDHAVAFQDQVTEWRGVLEQLARNFRDGHAAVDPKPDACEHCGLWGLCRIREFQNDRG